jgi:hypothetical protein
MATRKKKAAAKAVPEATTEELVADIERTPRPILTSSRDNAAAGRSDDWVEVRCIVANVHTSVERLKSGQTVFLPPDEAAALDARDQVKRL